ncbi:MAG: hypothetical protein JWM47_1870 [Acidimicrobiales bacterium]|nr:hypothetical protein [Acidimicrobiales bacterium]
MSEIENFRYWIEDDPLVLHAVGEIDLQTRGVLAEALEQLRAGPPPTLDLSGVTFMDSSGLAVLVNAAVADDRLRVRDPSPIVQRVIQATGLDDVLHLVP